MDNSNLVDVIWKYFIFLFITFNNLFVIFIQIIIKPLYCDVLSKEFAFSFYSFLSILLWLLVLVFIGNLTTKKDALNSDASFNDKLVNFFIRKNVKRVYVELKDQRVVYSFLLSIIGGLIGLFSLGNLYNKLYARFIVQFIVGLIIITLNMITIFNFPLTSDISDIFFYCVKYPLFIGIQVVYYILTLNDTYECAISIKKSTDLPAISKEDIISILLLIGGLFLFMITNMPSLWVLGVFTPTCILVILVLLAIGGRVLLK